jgi:ribosomal protein L40E
LRKKIPNKKSVPKSKRTPSKVQGYIICKKCGHKNPETSIKCSECDNTKFQPPWVKEHRKVNRAISVDITQSNPTTGEKKIEFP